jgi:hypothetical protein
MVSAANLPCYKELFDLESYRTGNGSNEEIYRDRDSMLATSMCAVGNHTDCSTPWLQKFILTLKGLIEISQVCAR